MVFSSLAFLSGFLPIFLAAYFLSPRKWRNCVLFVFSLFFYAWGEPIYVSLMIFSTVLDYTVGRQMEKCDAYAVSETIKEGTATVPSFSDEQKRSAQKKKRALLMVSVFVNLGMLGFFKYADFILTSIGLAPLGIPLPIGISFYTFQTMSYTIDVYRGNTPVQKNIINFGAYVAMFPQLIAGPIVRYVEVQKELDSRQENVSDFSDGVLRFIVGLSKKVLLANNLVVLWDSVKVLENPTMLTAWLGIVAFSLHLYFDFSGYSDMAIGLGGMLGFKFPENFNYPYISKSISEFWRRWHMTLGGWFREYLYFPLGGNRCSVAKNIRNLAIVWLATGLWHGAAWNFVMWGAYFGILLALEKYLWGKKLESAPNIVRHTYTLVLVIISWVLFEAAGIDFIFAMFGSNGLVDSTAMYMLSSFGITLVIGIICATPIFKGAADKLKENHYYILQLVVVVLFLFCLAGLISSGYNPFIYFRF